MPIIFPISSSPISGATTTAQTIMDNTAQDIRQQISSTAVPGQTILLDYVNRVSLTLLRVSRWKWLLSPVQRFATELQTTDYWIGAIGTGPTGTFDTGLDLTDMDIIKEDTVYDRSNFKPLLRTSEMPLSSRFSFRDVQSRAGRPAMYRNDSSSPYVLQLFPAPDNQNNYQPVPESPTASTAVGGALASRQYFIKLTLVDSLGLESSASTTSAEVWIPASSLVIVNPPTEPLSKGEQGIKYDRYNVYASTTLGQEKLQNVSPIAITATWMEPTTGLVTNTASAPTVNNITTLNGYAIEFRYFRARIPVSAPEQVLQVPDIYKDIVVAGVNQLAFQYLNRPREVAEWKEIFRTGLVQIIHDKNLFPHGSDFIRPDSASVGSTYSPSVESLDLSSLY